MNDRIRRDKQPSYGKLFMARVGLTMGKRVRYVKWGKLHLYRWYGGHFRSACEYSTYRGSHIGRNKSAATAKYTYAQYIKTYTIETMGEVSKNKTCSVCFPDPRKQITPYGNTGVKRFERAKKWIAEYAKQYRQEQQEASDSHSDNA